MTAPLKSAAASVASAAAGSAGFVPRSVFEVSPSITRSYFLGHHAGALTSMRKVLSNVGLILECRDSRVPLTSANPLLESALAGRDRIIVYTKADLCAPPSASRWMEKQQRLLSEWHSPYQLSSSSSSASASASTSPQRHDSSRGETPVAHREDEDGDGGENGEKTWQEEEEEEEERREAHKREQKRVVREGGEVGRKTEVVFTDERNARSTQRS